MRWTATKWHKREWSSPLSSLQPTPSNSLQRYTFVLLNTSQPTKTFTITGWWGSWKKWQSISQVRLHPLNTSCTLYARRESVATLLWCSRTDHNQTCTYMHRSTYVFSNTTGLQEVIAHKGRCQTCTYLRCITSISFHTFVRKSWTVAVILWSHIILTKGVLNATCVSVRTYYSTCHKNFTKSVCTLNTMQSIYAFVCWWQ